MTVLLLDTHALVWAWRQPDLLSDTVRQALADPGVTALVSAVSAYEIDHKRARDPALLGLPDDIAAFAVETGFLLAPITVPEAAAAARLPPVHRDPWDRLLVAQAQARGAQLVTMDRTIPAYGVPVLW